LNNSFSNLADRIRDELADLQLVVQKCERAWQETKRQPERLETLIGKLPQLWRTIEPELNAFADFLDDLSQY